MYLSERIKEQLRYIITLWNELGHAPSFKEFDDDPRTPKANSLSYDFGSYSAAIEKAKSYYNHPELLRPSKNNDVLPQKTTPGKPANKRLANKKTNKPTTKVAAGAPKTPSTPPKPQEAQKPPTPRPNDAKKPLEGQKLPDLNTNRPLLVNYYHQKIALITSDHFLSYTYGGSTSQYSYQIIQRSAYTAKAESTSHRTGSNYHSVSELITFDVPILKVTKRPILSRVGHITELPAPKPDTFLIVPYDVAVAAHSCGRATTDLVFPATFYEESNICWCCELGQI